MGITEEDEVISYVLYILAKLGVLDDVYTLDRGLFYPHEFDELNSMKPFLHLLCTKLFGLFGKT
jgi:hypothetical protein